MSFKPAFRNIFLLLLALSMSGVVWAGGRRPEAKPPVTTPAQPSKETPIETPTGTLAWPYFTLFLRLHPEGEPQKVLDILKAHPELKATLLFPPRYFEDPQRRPLMSQFSVLQSSGQIEIGLALENEPMLPLLADLRSGGDNVKRWAVDFAWPEDVAAQVARASGKYQKRWGKLPAGIMPPYLSLTETVVTQLKRFRLNWVIGRPGEVSGIRFYGGTALIIPPKPPVIDELLLGGKTWAQQISEWAIKNPFVYIDAGALEDVKAEQYLLEILNKKSANSATLITMIPGQIFTEALKNEFELPKSVEPFVNDFSPWVATAQQKRAWTALVQARTTIDTYQSSGHANLQRLDAAMEEMCNAESGEFLLELGSRQAGMGGALSDQSTSERTFLATLSNIYRLCDIPIPQNLSNWFATRSWQKTTPKTSQEDGPFFREGAQSLTWNDPKEDGLSGGKYTAPVGTYPKGMFDLGEVTLSWNDTELTITAGVQESFSGKPTNVVPLVDLYIDVNRLADAGSTGVLRRRGNTLVMREAAWEYAVALSPNAAVLYQAIPGGAPRVLLTKPVVYRGKSFSATFSRQQLRGNPKSWRLSVGLMGTENNRRVEETTPAPVMINPSEKAFGGGAGVQLSAVIDILDATVEDQQSRYDIHSHGGPLTLPYVESQ